MTSPSHLTGALVGASAAFVFAGGAVALGQQTTPSPSIAFHWRSSPPLLSPGVVDGVQLSGLKDPSIVEVESERHVFMTTAAPEGWHIGYTRFGDWSDAAGAQVVSLAGSAIGPGYRAAPQVFYFEPQGLWYMVFQSGPPVFSTTNDLSDPSSWTAPKPFFRETPAIIRAATGQDAWLDFWVICDDASCYLFNTDDHGNLFRSKTSIEAFPEGFSDTTRVLAADRDDLFEASLHYRIAGTSTYLTLVEAIGDEGRYFRAWTSDRLDGDWRPLAGGEDNPFAGARNVDFDGPAWSLGVSHGELVRSGYDQTLTIDPCEPLRFLYQGLASHGPDKPYIELPYRLGLLTADGPNPISALCPVDPSASVDERNSHGPVP